MCEEGAARGSRTWVFFRGGGRRFKNGSVLFVIVNRSKAAFALLRSVTVVTGSRAPWLRAHSHFGRLLKAKNDRKWLVNRSGEKSPYNTIKLN